MGKNIQYAAFLRGINVGGHHKLPMADLKKALAHLGFEKIETLLNSGNVIFEASETEEGALQERISRHLEEVFSFAVPVLVRRGEDILALAEAKPFEHIAVTKDTRLYISFIARQPELPTDLSQWSKDPGFEVLDIRNRAVFSVLDLSKTKTTRAMEILEKQFGKQITTRNWKTIEKIADKLIR